MTDLVSASDSSSGPANRMFLIVPHATNPVSPLPKAIRADSAGTVTFRAAKSDQDVTVNLAAGEQLDVRAKYVRVAGTNVATLHGLA
jgi:hypothetical protein